jgi:hypothetical protein
MAPTPPETPELSNLTEANRTAAGVSETLAGSMPVVELIGAAPASREEGQTTDPATRTIVPVAPEDDPLTVVVDPGTDPAEEGRPRSIFEAAQAEKERRKAVGESTMVLTNETLKEYSKGQITYVEDETDPEDASEDTGAALEASSPPSVEDELHEEYWRTLMRDLRIAWRDAYDSIEDHELDIARLRREFYAEDDPFYRDSQIKPAWDQALEDLEEAERTVTRSQRELEQSIDDGRRAGALPGWLREGIEFEPILDEEEDEFGRPRDDRFHEASEPVIVDDDGGG